MERAGHARQRRAPDERSVLAQCDPSHLANSPHDFFVGATLDTRTTVPTSARGVQLALQAHNASYNDDRNGAHALAGSEAAL
jgi:hypothetical protein